MLTWHDIVWHQLGRETVGPSSEERHPGGVDGEHWVVAALAKQPMFRIKPFLLIAGEIQRAETVSHSPMPSGVNINIFEAHGAEQRVDARERD